MHTFCIKFIINTPNYTRYLKLTPFIMGLCCLFLFYGFVCLIVVFVVFFYDVVKFVFVFIVWNVPVVSFASMQSKGKMTKLLLLMMIIIASYTLTYCLLNKRNKNNLRNECTFLSSVFIFNQFFVWS